MMFAVVVLFACAGKKQEDNCEKCTQEQDSTAEGQAAANAPPLKYQDAVAALSPYFKAVELPVQVYSGPDQELEHRDVPKDLLVKHLGYDLKDAASKDYFGVAALGRFESPGGDTRFIVSHYGLTTGEYLLYAYHEETQRWVPLVITISEAAKDKSALIYRSAGIYPDGNVVLTDWKTQYHGPGEPPPTNEDDVLIGNKIESTYAFKGGKWVKN